ncbi:hypothetical protein EG68_04417 [Paragonimus skrjabini miyazakii]|uniref:Uncharacterized protein n=1 Tax=Paragonimus skrjabini miyazakii TaxID=59628 RepID=A0A8S9YZV4_9TREM|nr:hypothetical protein EG68_04417 [Paragonimus skrjabini miyazakii]
MRQAFNKSVLMYSIQPFARPMDYSTFSHCNLASEQQSLCLVSNVQSRQLFEFYHRQELSDAARALRYRAREQFLQFIANKRQLCDSGATNHIESNAHLNSIEKETNEPTVQTDLLSPSTYLLYSVGDRMLHAVQQYDESTELIESEQKADIVGVRCPAVEASGVEVP